MNIFMMIAGVILLIVGAVKYSDEVLSEKELSSTVIVSEKAFISSFGVNKVINYEDGSSSQEIWRIVTPPKNVSGHGLMLNDPEPRLVMVQAFHNAGSDK